jgi:hypothetical protein
MLISTNNVSLVMLISTNNVSLVMLISTNNVSLVMLKLEKKIKTVQELEINLKKRANSVKDRNIHEGELSFVLKRIYKIDYFLDRLIDIRIFKQVPNTKLLDNCRNLETYSPPAEASTQGLKYKYDTNFRQLKK